MTWFPCDDHRLFHPSEAGRRPPHVLPLPHLPHRLHPQRQAVVQLQVKLLPRLLLRLLQRQGKWSRANETFFIADQVLDASGPMVRRREWRPGRRRPLECELKDAVVHLTSMR